MYFFKKKNQKINQEESTQLKLDNLKKIVITNNDEQSLKSQTKDNKAFDNTKHDFDKEYKKDYVNPIQRSLHVNKQETGISEISGRRFLEFDNNLNIYPVDKNRTYRSDILQTMPKYLADLTYDKDLKNDQPTLISKRRIINEYGYVDLLNDEQKKKSSELKPLIEVKDLCVIFKDKKQKKYAVNNISFNINPNENIAFIGANGAGKTTTVETIAGINKPTEGKILYNYDYKKSFQEGIGIQFQDSSYPKGVTVKNVIDFLKDAYGLNKDKINDLEFDHLLDVFRIKEFYHTDARKLSGGQQQRLNVLLSLMHKPKVLFLDELVTGLDIQIRNELENFI
ncbi:MAG: ABC transporter ATP-binding protein, partial [Mycoplasmataceae bacterium]|nr:ABC transporter ATP-binding protein [Mycoplasmataceae bacterium]